MNNPSEHYDRLHDHMSAIARERDWLLLEVERLKMKLMSEIDAISKTLEEVRDELNLAHEAMRRAFPENQR
jgi:hypothetical protein